MSDIFCQSMDKLPVEMLHRIFDHVDIETLFFSIRPVCRYFQSTVHNYDRLDFHSKFISKCNFNVLCRLITPENIRSLTLYNTEQTPDQISPFLGRVHLEQLTRLHSIDLNGIDQYRLNYLSDRINLNSLQLFSVHLINYDDRRNITVDHLLTIFQQLNLRTIEFKIDGEIVEWPSTCSIECLILYECIDYENLVRIYSCSPRLNRLIIKEDFFYLSNSDRLRSSFSQLTSLILEEVCMSINQVERFLSLTPSLVHLKLIGYCDIFDGKRWEDFIQRNLHHLNRFQFEITFQSSLIKSREDLDLFVQSYRSSFWIELKKWFITVEVDLDGSCSPRIYSLPLCRCLYRRQFNPNRIVCSTSNQIYPTKNITELILSFKSSFEENLLSSVTIPSSNLRKLRLDFDTVIPVYYVKYFQTTIDVSQLVEVKLENGRFCNGNEDFLVKFFIFLQKSPKLSSLILHIQSDKDQIYPYLGRIIEYLPSQIHHLEIPIKEIKQIEIILERCQHLSVLQFPVQDIQQSKEIKEWFETNTSDSIYRKSHRYNTIWIGKRKETNSFNYKRMKFNEE